MTETTDEVRRRASSFVQVLERRAPARLVGLVRRLARHELLLTASSLAFYGLVSVLPLLLIAFALVEAVAGEQALQTFVEQASGNGPEGSEQVLDQLASKGGSVTFVTVLFALWPATAYGGGLRRAMLTASDRDDPAPGLRGRVTALVLVFVLPVLVLTGVPTVYVLTTLSGDGLVQTVVGWALALTVAIGVLTALTALLFKAFSPEQLPWPATLRASSTSAAVTTVFSIAFVTYLGVVDVEERFGGGTTAIVVLLGVWLFVANVLLLAGHEAVLELDDGPSEDEAGRAGDGDPRRGSSGVRPR